MADKRKSFLAEFTLLQALFFFCVIGALVSGVMIAAYSLGSVRPRVQMRIPPPVTTQDIEAPRFALHVAVRNDDKAAVLKLLESGADPDAPDIQEGTPLHWAARWGDDAEVVALLLKHGADINAIDSSGMTPLDVALQRKDEAVIGVFRSLGAKEGKEIQNGR